MNELPPEAFPIASYGESQHMTLDAIRADSAENAHLLYISGLIIGTHRGADDSRFRAGIEIARKISESAERYGAQLRAELERRDRDRQAEIAQAAERAHPYPGGHHVEPVDTEICQTLALPDATEVVHVAE